MLLHPLFSFRRALLLLGAFLSVAGPTVAEERWQLETQDAGRVELELTCQVEADRPWRGDISLVTAKAPEVPGQRNVTTEVKPAARPAVDSSPLRRPVLVSRWAGAPGLRRFTLTLHYKGVLRSRRLVRVPEGASPPLAPRLSDAERKLYLRTGTSCDYKSRTVQAWLDDHHMRRKEGESAIDFARRVHLEICKSFRYRFPAGHDGKCSTVCKAGQGDCGSLSVVFVSALRSNNIPARVLVGGELKSEQTQPFAYHVVAEFHADGVGWIPVDPAVGLGRDRPGSLSVFGQDEGRFFTQHIDPDVSVNLLQRRGVMTCSVLQQPARWFSGPGPWDNISFKEKWTVKTLPPDPSDAKKQPAR